MGQYNSKGLYAGYKKNNKEREALDYYATPPKEVLNILETIAPNFTGKTILEPCVGGGHMLDGIKQYLTLNHQIPSQIYISDVKNRVNWPENEYSAFDEAGDFLKDDYPFSEADYVIMNPPFATIEPFTIRALEIAKERLIMFGRLQFLEGQSRYEKIFKDNPPNDIYVYVDRVQCGKNGVFVSGSSVQAYAWYVWDRTGNNQEYGKLHWIKRK